VAQIVEHLFFKHQALSSNPGTTAKTSTQRTRENNPYKILRTKLISILNKSGASTNELKDRQLKLRDTK
jgi:hypothetical protein